MMKSYKFKSNRLKYSTASGPASFKTAKPPGNDLNGHSFTMCCIVCCKALSAKPHLYIREPHRPWLVRKRFNNTHSCRRSSKPGGLEFGSRMRSPLIGNDVDQCDNQVSAIGNSESDENGSKLQTGLRETNLSGGMSNIDLYVSNGENTHSTFRGQLRGSLHSQKKNLLGKSAQCHRHTGTVLTMSPECRKGTDWTAQAPIHFLEVVHRWVGAICYSYRPYILRKTGWTACCSSMLKVSHKEWPAWTSASILPSKPCHTLLSDLWTLRLFSVWVETQLLCVMSGPVLVRCNFDVYESQLVIQGQLHRPEVGFDEESDVQAIWKAHSATKLAGSVRGLSHLYRISR